jgi:hypothetical protein
LVGDEFEQATIEAAANRLPRQVPFVVFREHVQQYPLPLARNPELVHMDLPLEIGKHLSFALR